MGPLREQVIAMQRKIEDLLDKPNDSAAQRLKSEIKRLEDDMQAGKNPITVEDGVKRIIHLLEGPVKSNRVMNYEHIDMFKHWFEHLRETLRRMA